MAEPTDHLPADFDVSSLSEPRPETLALFNEVCKGIDAIGIVDRPSPDPDTGEVIDLYSTQFWRKQFHNGSRMDAVAFHGSDEYLEELGESEPVRRIRLKTADKIEYSYSAFLNGSSKLFVKKPGERVRRETDNVDKIDIDAGSGVSASLSGTPELMHIMLEALAERREADRLGLSKPTEASLKEFTTALQTALTSGMVEDK